MYAATVARIEDAEPIRFDGGCLGVIVTGGTPTAFAFHTSGSKDGTYVPIHDESGNPAVAVAAAGRAVRLPEILFPFEFIKITADQECTVDVCRKG